MSAVDTASQESNQSSQSCAITQPGPTPPLAPTGLSAQVVDGYFTGTVTLTWNPSSGATSYNIYWSTSSGVSKTTGTLIPNVTSPFIDNTISQATTYYYVVTAVNSNGESSESNKISATNCLTPTARTNDATASTSTLNGMVNSVGLTTTWHFEWGTSTSYGNKAPIPDGTIQAGVSTSVSTNLGGLVSGTTYHYRTVATNICGTSYGSNKSFVKP